MKLEEYLKDHEFVKNEHGVVIATCDNGTRFNLFILIEEYAKHAIEKALKKSSEIVLQELDYDSKKAEFISNLILNAEVKI